MSCKIEKIKEASMIFEIGKSVSINEINKKYKDLLFKWHPDHSSGDIKESKEMTQKIVDLYRVLMEYFYNYEFEFSVESIDVTKIDEDPENFWNTKFGHDPLWGYTK